ncbi:ras GEF [Trametopsis cervina]|nr:ras GEF [Trametopsis cervina]
MTDHLSISDESNEDVSHVSTPIASHQHTLSSGSPLERGSNKAIQSSTEEYASIADEVPLAVNEDANHESERLNARTLVLPIPTGSSTEGVPTVALPEGRPPMLLVSLDDLPAEATLSSITVGSDSRYVDTSSGAVAHGLKRLYDQHLGVGRDVRSPFVITAFINQHGKQMYRIGRREMSAPAATAADAESLDSRMQSSTGESISTGPPSHIPPRNPLPHTRRGSRVSVHSFFKTGVVQQPPKTVPEEDGNRSPPGRKLRKTRSIPNMASVNGTDQAVSPITPTLVTGRPHAHSVSSVDAFRPPSLPPLATELPPQPPAPDVLASVMSWNSVPHSPISSGSGLRSTRSFYSMAERPSEISGDEKPTEHIRHPFGRGIAFDTPIRPSLSHLTSPPVLREMQSFESGLTARADPAPRSARLGKLRARLSDESVYTTEEAPSSIPEVPDDPPTIAEPLPEALVYSRYSTDLFDVLQNYKGLPVLDKVADIPDPPTIKLSLKAEETAVPRDDPRFVIWGEVDRDDGEDASASRSTVELSSVTSALSRRKSTKERASIAEHSPPKSASSNAPTRVLVAATIERWIAQLTSELNYDELLIFFLTYRTYISALDLGHLLICRFHWALGVPTSPQDEMVRRIVRVRTFIAIRYWLLTFFSVDFVPDRALRLLFANWLNTLRHDPILTRHKDAANIVQKLRKVALDCKEAHTQGHNVRKQSVEKVAVPATVSVDFSQGDFAENLRKAVGKGTDDADIDLDFDGAQTVGLDSALKLNAGTVNGNLATAVDLAMMRQPLHLAFLQMGKQNTATTQTDNQQPPFPLPVSHSALSRAVVNAIGRLGRWKRVLNYRAMNTRGAPIRPPLGLGAACVDASPFDLEASETGDLLTVRGGVETYLKMIESQLGKKAPTGSSFMAALSAPPPLGLVPSTASSSTNADSPGRQSLEPLTEISDEGTSTEEGGQIVPTEQPRPVSAVSSVPTESVQFRHSFSDTSSAIESPWQVDVVSIDDLQLSDLSSEDLHAPTPPSGLRKMPRRLPNRRDFELVRRSTDSVSSMGIHTNPARDSVLSAGSSVASSMSGGPEAAGPIHGWQVDALIDSLTDEEESGDVEAALRRLEGQINQENQRRKQTKVDAWVKSINKPRPENGHSTPATERYSSDEEDYGEVQSSLRNNGREITGSRSSTSQVFGSQPSSRTSLSSAVSPSGADSPNRTMGPAKPPGLDIVSAAEEGITKDAAPSHGLNPEPGPPSTATLGRMSVDGTSSLIGRPGPQETSAFVKPEKSWKKHRSFILAYKSEVIVQHFSVIDRDLFLSLKFEELVSQDWMNSTDNFEIMDWAQYVRERHIMKVENHIITPALTVIRSRFNLTVNFVVSEIMLTHPSERLMIYSKFIRIAWKAYTLKNYHLLIAVLAGLDSVWVQKALKQTQAKKPGIWESRMLRDLHEWSTNQEDFKHIRNTVDALAEAKTRIVGSPESSQAGAASQSSTSRGRAASEGKAPATPSCVPFFGVYLSQLYRYNSLPDLIDPTAPHEPVGVDPETNTFHQPAHPEVFSYLAPLPPSVQLEPLINVHKQRLIAGVVKSFVAGQHLAAKVEYTPDKKLFQKCFKLRGLEPDTLHRVLALYSNWDT